MVDVAPQFEQIDNIGTTVHLNGTVGTTSTPIPAAPGFRIAEFWIQNPAANPKTMILSVSVDGGVTFRTLPWNSQWAWTPKGNIPQLFIKANVAGCLYECVANIEVG